MRHLIALGFLALFCGCGGGPSRELTVPPAHTGLVGAWRVVPYHGPGLDAAGDHRRFGGLATGGHLQLLLSGRFQALPPEGGPPLTGDWLVRSKRLILRGFAPTTRYAHPTTAEWPIVRLEPNLFVVRTESGASVAFQRVLLP